MGLLGGVRRGVKVQVQRAFRRLGYSIVSNNDLSLLGKDLGGHREDPYAVRAPYSQIEFAGAGLQKLVEDYEFRSVIDIGAGAMEHAKVFASLGKKVTAVDYGNSVYFKKYHDENYDIDMIIGDFNALEFPNTYDCVWASHVLEHQVNVDGFLKKIRSLLNDDGVLAITVPPLKHEIVGGHVSLWNAGLVMYRLVLAGFNCRQASVLRYGYNITVIVRKTDDIDLTHLQYDRGDIRRIKAYLPENLHFNSNEVDDPFDGDIWRLNW